MALNLTDICFRDLSYRPNWNVTATQGQPA
jgi:hypothetical protein